ncbi:MAG: hypothetical protein R3E89_03615 [Thiolinea sp.]
MVFKNLGLAIIDEEHRFGVRHKEQLKKLRADVDMLTMTATLIPRTLNMSLSGLRDLVDYRHPAGAAACHQNLCQRMEQNAGAGSLCARNPRGGQVYVLHNEVKKH